MSYQSEAELENQLLQTLQQSLLYEYKKISDVDELEENFRDCINKLNIERLEGIPLSDKEFERLMTYVKGKNVFQSAKQLREQKYDLQRDDGKIVYITLLDLVNPEKNKFQVSHQIVVQGKYENRYDVTILINGIPVVQVELKRRGLSIKEAFNQIKRYARHSYTGLFRYIQIFVVSNGVNTKYFANSDSAFEFRNTFFWTDKNNNHIGRLGDFAQSFLTKNNLIEMIDDYTVLKEVDKYMMVMRPYQVYAVKESAKIARTTASNCYNWIATGGGKTLTSFKLAQTLANDSNIAKVIFMVDRSDLDSQTVDEFNNFEAGSVDATDNTKTLIKQMRHPLPKFIATTIQKMNVAVTNPKYSKIMEEYADKKIIFIADECHRSQFGKMYVHIKKMFKKAQFIGFTGTPRFKENKSSDGRTTADLFGKCVYTYLTKDAINDHNVLGFSVEYIQTFSGQYDENDGQCVVSIDKEEVYESDERVSLIVNHVLQTYDAKTNSHKYNAIFACSRIPMLVKYYNAFKSVPNNNLRIGAVFSFQANADMEGKDEIVEKHSREWLDEIISDYNKQFGTKFDSSTFAAYNRDVSKRMKKGELDLLLVVNMYLTGWDSPKLSCLYTDKSLRWHDLMQAFSRTNRLYDVAKVWGNIVCYRNLKPETDSAIRLFSQTDNINEVLQPDYNTCLDDFKAKLRELYTIVLTPDDVDKLEGETIILEFVNCFKMLAQKLLELKTFAEFDFIPSVCGIDEQTFEDFKSKYQDIYDQHKRPGTEKTSILDDIDYEIEMIQTDRINVDYIMTLLRDMDRSTPEKEEKSKEHIIKELDRSDNPVLRKKSELIKSFLLEAVPHVSKDADMEQEYVKYEEIRREEDIEAFAKENSVDKAIVKELISEYEYTGNIQRNKIMDTIKLPFLKLRKLANKIVEFIIENVEKYQ